MKNYIYYIILKSYKGIFKKRHVGNTHLFFIPVNSKETFYLILIGKLISEKNSYVCQLVNRIPHMLRAKIVEEQKNEFKERYIVMEAIKCNSTEVDDETFEINVPSKGKYILSNLKVSFDPKHTTERQRIYRLDGNINLETYDVPDESIKSLGIKKLALLRKRL